MHSTWQRRHFLKAAAAAILVPSAPAARAALAPLQRAALPLFNTHTGERVTIDYRNADGTYVPDALSAINHIFRCHYNNEETHMDLATLDFLSAVYTRLEQPGEIQIISGFRSQAYNNLLARQSSGVAKHSLHLIGKAVDIRMPKVPLRSLQQAALQLGLGGVGFYPKSDFVHIDSGRRRSW